LAEKTPPSLAGANGRQKLVFQLKLMEFVQVEQL
jgi:hypothetical protein